MSSLILNCNSVLCLRISLIKSLLIFCSLFLIKSYSFLVKDIGIESVLAPIAKS